MNLLMHIKELVKLPLRGDDTNLLMVVALRPHVMKIYLDIFSINGKLPLKNKKVSLTVIWGGGTREKTKQNLQAHWEPKTQALDTQTWA